jgi:hypothetical protein
MAVSETVPVECRGVDFESSLERLPGRIGELFFAAGEQRLLELNQAMASGDAGAVMDAAHSLASLTGLLHIQALADYAQVIYAAAQRGELETARHAHERLDVVLGWAMGRVRPPVRTGAGAGPAA